MKPECIFWGLTASPYQLKMQSLADFAEYDWQRWPQQGGYIKPLFLFARLRRALSKEAVRRFPQMSKELDEYPSVPFYTLDSRNFYYDSSSLAQHLDNLRENTGLSLVPEEPALAFLAHLIDEAFDEFGLYMVHHMRWVGSARSTEMGHRTVREMGLLALPPLRNALANRLYHRQVRRCPYLFSVAPEGFDAGVPPARTPPARDGFPPTHALLESSWKAYLAAMESILVEQPFILGERFTLADASAYGQLGMNLVDPEAAELMQQTAPRVYQWLLSIDKGEHRGGEGELRISSTIKPLLQNIGGTFIPLMQQNEAAFDSARDSGETLFNEAAFDRGRALYNGELMGHPFRAVIKTFQVQVWRDLKKRWAALAPGVRSNLAREYLPWAERLD